MQGRVNNEYFTIKYVKRTVFADLHLVQTSEGLNGQVVEEENDVIVEVTKGTGNAPQVAIVVIEIGDGK